MKIFLASALTFVVATVASCAAPTTSSSNSIIEARNAAFSEAFASGDGGRVAALYADGAIVMPDGANPVEGSEAIAQFWQGFIDSGARRVELTTDDTIATGATTIAERGRFGVFDAAGVSLGEGKYVVVWTLQDSEWKLQWDIWNANVPPAQ